MTDKFVQTAFGRLHYCEWGEGEPLVLLHSNGCSAHEFAGVADTLARTHRVIAWDMPGHGDSDPIDRHHTIEMYEEALIAFLNVLDIPDAHVLGVSVGGMICACLGARHPERARNLMVVEAAFRSADGWERIWERVERNFGQATQTLEVIAPRFRAADEDFLARWNIDRNKAGVKTMIDVMWAIRDFDMAGALSKISIPMTVVFGDKGPAIETMPEFTNVRPEERPVILADCGHFPMLDDPMAFSRTVRDILSKG